ncbi:hypothetical protein [Massilia sp. X63]|uniref:hypothetical protein n=1 Tax=Massilia sp. X63 TaxID=3237285 RepID=UPI0034DD7F1B
MKHESPTGDTPDQHQDIAEASSASATGATDAAASTPKEQRATKTSTERGSAADKALLEAGGAIVSRLRLRPIAARALTILMEREGDVYGKQRAAIENALIFAAGGTDVLEQLLADEQAAREAEAAALAAEQRAAEERAAAQAQEQADREAEEARLGEEQEQEHTVNRKRLSLIENDLVALLEKGPITGAAEVGHRLWSDREMQPQGAACAVNGILRRLVDRGYVASTPVGDRQCFSVTEAGRDAREHDRLDDIDPRQLTLLTEE